MPPVPSSFADDTRRAEVLTEIQEARPDVIVLLGTSRFVIGWPRTPHAGTGWPTLGRVETPMDDFIQSRSAGRAIGSSHSPILDRREG